MRRSGAYPSSVKLNRSGRAHRWLPACLALVVTLSAVLGRAWAQADGHPEVTVAVLRDAAPFSFQAPDGTRKELAVEMWNRVAAQLHLDARFVDMSRSDLIDAVSAGQARFGIGALSITADRLQRVDFSAPIDVTGVAIVVTHVPRSLWGVIRDAVFSLQPSSNLSAAWSRSWRWSGWSSGSSNAATTPISREGRFTGG